MPHGYYGNHGQSAQDSVAREKKLELENAVQQCTEGKLVLIYLDVMLMRMM